MLSHDLAHTLLNMRNNDIRIEVLLDDDPTGETYHTKLVELRCDDTTIDDDLREEPTIVYSPTADVVVIRTGVIVTIGTENAEATG